MIYRVDYTYNPYAKSHPNLIWRDSFFVHAKDKLSAIDKIARLMDPIKPWKNGESTWHPRGVSYRVRETDLQEEVGWLINKMANVLGLPDGYDGIEIEITDELVAELKMAILEE
jgi:hypothetical protein